MFRDAGQQGFPAQIFNYFQKEGKENQHSKCKIGKNRQRGRGNPRNPRIKGKSGFFQRHSQQSKGQQKSCRAGHQTVSCCVSEQGEMAAPFQTVSPRLHGTSRINRIFQRPSQHSGKYPHCTFELIHIAVGGIQPHSFLRLMNFFDLCLEQRNKPQRCRKQKRELGNHLAEQKKDFLACHNVVKTAHFRF